MPQRDGRHFYKEGKGTPSPLLLTRFAGQGGWEEPCRAVVSLSKMNWNNGSLYDRLPVTLSYASTLARVFKRIATPSPPPVPLLHVTRPKYLALFPAPVSQASESANP